MTKHDTEPEFEFPSEDDRQLHIWLALHILGRIDNAMESLPQIRSREGFVATAVLWALESMSESLALTNLWLEEF